ncbi:hypothetical protein E5161_07880 [Cohnella pontilimi]|uniref:Fibronectin type-III domain-containing protein n=1 Tax=Cohnella pontilimi TaxID=2564100 RepID=A0A4U0FDB4_9BACL|nr:S8 family serine peptidase [Cohnella pontilimi]TJY42751.1 hypothetical protein E5161_07880 [Cohnella pontilimi]
MKNRLLQRMALITTVSLAVTSCITVPVFAADTHAASKTAIAQKKDKLRAPSADLRNTLQKTLTAKGHPSVQPATNPKDKAPMSKPRKSTWKTAPAKQSTETVAPIQVQSAPSDNAKSTFRSKPSSTAQTRYAPDEIIVKFKPGAKADQLLTKFMLKTKKKFPSIGAELLQTPKGAQIDSLVQSLKNDASVVYAQPNYIVHADQVPNDPNFTQLWGLDNTGQTIGTSVGTPNVDINAPEAWDISKGSSSLIVAVIDTGVDINHPELKNAIWTNPAEIPGNGKDDDGNGYVDDVNGWDFYHQDNTVFDPLDGDEHGTHVSGTIAAAFNNSTGVAGVAPNVKILPVKFLGPHGGSTADAILSVEYAAKMGAKISNNSWGGGDFDQALKDAIEASKMLFVAAAGNDSLNNDANPHYPSSYDSSNILSVAAVNNKGNVASFSNYGVNSVDIAAPGQAILSSVPKQARFGAAAQIDNGVYKAIFNGFGFENMTDANERQDAFNKAITFLKGTATNNNVLLVDDDSVTSGSGDYKTVYTNLLTTSGNAPANTISVVSTANGPDLATLNGYKIVVWFTGDQFNNALTDTDRSNLTAYLNGGGKLLLAGPDSVYGNESTAFVTDILHLDVISEGLRSPAVGVNGTIYSGVSYQSVSHPYSDYVVSLDPNVTKINLEYSEDPDYSGAYAYFNGTSMATPHATGAAALLYSVNPGLTPQQAITILNNTGTPLSSLTGKVGSGKMVNAYQALTASAESLDNDIPGLPLNNPVVHGTLDELNDPDDVFSVYLNAGQMINISLSGAAGTDFDLYLFDPSAATVNNSAGMVAYSEGAGTSNEAISYIATVPGTYYIDVFAYAGSGSYDLNTGNGPGTYEDSDARVSFGGNWTSISDSGFSGGTAKQTNSVGSTAKFSFVGSEIEWIGFKDSAQGVANVYLDGALVASPSLYSGTKVTKQSIFKRSTSFGSHSIRIEWTGQRDPAARKSGTNINVDSLIVSKDTVPPTVPAGLSAYFDMAYIAPRVQWTANSDDTSAYNIYRKAAGQSDFVKVGQSSTPSFYDTQAAAGTTYQYAVSAVDGAGNESALSAPVTFVHDDNIPGVPAASNFIAGSLDYDLDGLDIWSVNLQAGNTYSFSANGPAGTNFDYYLLSPDSTNIYSMSGYTIVGGTDLAGSEEYFTFPITTSGKYYLLVGSSSGSGNYTVNIGQKATVADDDIPGTPLSGNAVSDFLDSQDIDDVYSVQLRAGDTITANLSSSATNGNDFDLYLFGPGATTVNPDKPGYTENVAVSNNAGTSTESLTYVADATGTYYIDVYNWAGTGPYNLSVNVVPRQSVTTVIEDNDPAVRYSGTSWRSGTDAKNSGGNYHIASVTGSFSQLTFNGNSVKLLSKTATNRGLADVYIDGVLIKTIDQYSSTTKYQVKVFEATGLADGQHTIKVVLTGQKQPASTSTEILIDAFVVTQN